MSFADFNPLVQSLLAGIFTWLATMFGSSFVYMFKEVNDRFLAIMQGFAGGVMVAASFWSLLAPALEYAAASQSSLPEWLPVAIGFLLGGVFLRIIDHIVPHIHLESDHGDTAKEDRNLSRTMMLFLAVTIHNIPEGLAIGVAFAAASLGEGGSTLAGAIALALGIGLQNIPEGSALSLPIYASGKSKHTAFTYGHMSAFVEPIAAVIGAGAVLIVSELLPYALAFAAGAMIFVVIEELVPESQGSNHVDDATLAFLFGFTVMMVLDVALG